MPKYKNGYIPDSELVTIEGNHKATRGTAARWAALKADVLRNEGVTLKITGGENAYRSYAGQVFARNAACRAGRCNDAAVPGTSSHGGSLNGRDSGAIDVSNWAVLGKDKFYAYCRRNGFEPGYFDWEPWHIIDWAPYTVPSSGGGGSGEEDMPLSDDDIQRIWTHMIGLPTQGRAADWLTNLAAAVESLRKSLPAAVWDEMIQARDSSGNPVLGVKFKARDFEASTNALVQQPVTDVQIKAIAAAVAKAIGTPTVTVDEKKIADAVREVFRTDPLK